MSEFLDLAEPNVAQIQREIAETRKRIELAKANRAAIDKGITQRETYLSRLEARLALSPRSHAFPRPAMIGR